ncbi:MULTISPECIES: glutamate ABC transporter substrate-binding protein [Rhodococcus]|uniref:Glutamate ABC transporter substrate-binding protein n=1 Tax=Rhodococcus oxybenzonivorans TaxID=1990687 RepID=A0AAE4V463_9NOCA|nr:MULTISPECIES: glutamate ABC transporter substrate-binding protein [Rhodococcus]MDV7245996.1 glutamate ABC transporter substrate-binding protein [Rhodococcus oxybenzonivorans]MDV7268032.1 glutamate ABC transporter substrate-binding protein [Rhodococcus oxybenzonivorans]MDV7277591.1 glutamate ABC transporter substrate-binding protein [Rhodococcus oxybenzonivorans]MDV7337009.1 glutamate ABC transporter substrate-binding protein [Rhodococcus oxybenzonivorans]MDV7347397.1 glutamate ABC transport
MIPVDRPRRTRRRAFRPHLLVCACATVLFAGCATPQPLSPIPGGDYAEFPLSDGAQILPPSGIAPAEPPTPDTCGALASLRPGPAVPPGTRPPDSAVADILARGRLVVGLDQNTNLFSFRDPTTGTLMGFDVDVAKEVARDLFGDPSKVEYRLLTFGSRFDALENDEVDLVVKGTTITCERAERVAFSTVYFQAYQRLLVPKGSGIEGPADLAGKRVCTATETTSLATVQRVQPEATIVAVPDWDDCLVVLQQRHADAASTDDSILAGLAAQDPNLEIVGPPLESEPYGIGVNKSHEDLVRFVNGTLDRMRADGTWMALYDRWLTVLGPVPGPPAPTYRD